MAQWDATPRVIATFTEVFPYVLHVPPILLGSMEPIYYDRETIYTRLNDPAVQEYLAASQIDATRLRDMIPVPIQVWTPDDPRDYPSERINTDLMPRDEYFLNNGE
jgi:hypothetical protein